MIKKKRMESQQLILCFMMISPFLAGLYFEYLSCMAAAVLFLILVYIKKTTGHLYFRLNDASIAVMVLVISYGISVCVSVDKGLAVWGIFKFLSLFLFLLTVFQLKKEERLHLFRQVPFTGAIMSLLALILSVIPWFRTYFWVNGRLGGFFQYPNTFAMYLLTGILVLHAGDIAYTTIQKAILTIILIAGILAAGSRTVIVLGIAAALVLSVKKKKILTKQGLENRITLDHKIIGAFVFMLSGEIAFAISCNWALFKNFFSDTTFFSTFFGRLLYWQDAIGQILKHPFGMGYMGYYLTQGEFQSGVYSVMFVHNDWLQILLDVGWIPGICILAAVLKALFSKEQYRTQKLVLIFLGLHCMFDFDLQYIYMFFLMILTWNLDSEKKQEIPSGVLGALLILVLPGLYIGIGNLVYYTGNPNLAYKIYPYNTFAEIQLLSTTSEVEEMEQIADHLLERNEYLSTAWDAKAKTAYSRGDFSNVLSAKQKAISLAPYDIAIYEDYFSMLCVGIERYEEAGDANSAEICKTEIIRLQEILNQTKEKTSALAWMIRDKPQLEMSEEYRNYVEVLKNKKQ